MKSIKVMLTVWLCTTATIGWLYVSWTWWFQTDGWGYVGWYAVIWTDDIDEANWTDKPRLIQTIQKTINRVLWILWLIALILCLWWWFQMLTAAGDDWKVKAWTKVLKDAAIWLVVIGLSRILVSFIFRLINKNAVTTP